jgi:hypothetical protein
MKWYRGEWVGVHNGEVLAHGADLYEVTRQALQKNDACAYTHKVGDEHQLEVKIRRADRPKCSCHPRKVVLQ